MRLVAIVLLACLPLGAAEELDCSYRIKAESAEGNVVRTGYGLCSAIKVDGEKVVLTAAHVVLREKGKERLADEVLVDLPQGWIRCKVVKVDAAADLCLLRPAIEPPGVGKLAKEDDAKEKEEVKSVNYFAARRMASVDGVLCGKLLEKWIVNIDFLGHGCSGAGVFRGGKLFGVVVALGEIEKKETTFGFVVSLDEVKKFLKDVKVK
jgi:hypothetical protein